MKSIVKPGRPAVAPRAEAAAEVLVLIEEARARARRRRRRIALVVACAAALAAGTLAVVRSFSGNGPVARGQATRPSAVAPAPAGWPRFFADTEAIGGSVTGSGPLEIRDSATGKLMSEPHAPGTPAGVLVSPYAVAATGRRSFVAALAVRGTCATRLYRLQVNDRGRPGAMSRVGPTLPGMLWSLATSAGGNVIGYAISGCAKGDPGYLGVLDVPGGRMRQWTDFSLGGVSPGNLALNGPLSMPANGHLLAFAAAFTAHPSDGRITAQQVRVLPTDAPPGTVAARSHLVLRRSGTPMLGAAVLSPSGTSFYLCSQTSTRTKATAQIVAYRTATGKPTGVVATFTERGLWPQVGCSSMALDASGRFLLVQYALSYSNPRDPYAGRDLFRMARIDIATKAKSTLTISLPDSSNMDRPDGMDIAW